MNINHSRNTPEFKEHSLLEITIVNINTEKYVVPINKLITKQCLDHCLNKSLGIRLYLGGWHIPGNSICISKSPENERWNDFHAGGSNCTSFQLLVAKDFLHTKFLNGRDSLLDISIYTRFLSNQNTFYMTDFSKFVSGMSPKMRSATYKY